MVKLKLATQKNCYFWWKIRNEKSVREASFDTKSIPYSTHKKWFEEKLNNKNSKLFIILSGNQKTGQLRLEKDGSKVKISLALIPASRGKGVGTKAIQLGAKYALEKMKAIKVAAFTKPENLASIKSFEKAGFKNRGSIIYKNQRATLLEFSQKSN